MRRIAIIVALLAATVGEAAPSILTDNLRDVGYTNIVPAINAVLGTSPSRVDNPIFNDVCVTSGTSCNSTNLVAASSNGAGAYTSIASGLPSNHATYQVISTSAPGLTGPVDVLYYATLEAQGTVYSLPNGIGSTVRQPPPVTGVRTSSPNSSDGSSGWGIEFGLSASYLGLNTADDSHDGPAMAGFLAALLYSHPTWNAFDVKAALRQTASLWATGYDHTAFGYGLINWTNANAASTLYLQSPRMDIVNYGYYATIMLYPYRQTRRAKEAVYIGGTWPSPATGCSGSTCNEYTAAQIAGAGGTLLYTSNGTDVTPTFSYAAAMSGTATFYVLTLDASGNGSRVEEYNALTESFTVGAACH